jgi:putative mRNA 3-end processing factor
MLTPSLIQPTERGLYCPVGNFYIDPWLPVERAIVTHAHADHARRGSQSYLINREGEQIFRTRLGPEAHLETVLYGETRTFNEVKISLHPAGHILGSAQVRVEYRGEIWVVSGDYKVTPDPTCTPFEFVRCHAFITEATFALPVYRWPAQAETFAEVNNWWQGNQAAGKASLLFGYALGKAQRLLAGLDPAIGPIYTHGAVERLVRDYRDSGINLPATLYVGDAPKNTDWSRALILAPPSAHGTPWSRRFGAFSTAFASGWMRIRGTRRRRAVDRGFVLSDHADWPQLMDTIRATGAEQIWVTHGYIPVLVRWLQEQGLDARPLPTQFEGDEDEENGDELESPGNEPASFRSGG